MKSYRPQRVGGQIKRELSEIFQLNRSEFGGYLLTVTEVRLPRDLRNARVWVSVYGSSDERSEAIKLLNRMSGRIRHLLIERIHIKRIPELTFKLDETLYTAERIDILLKESGMMDKQKAVENRMNEDQSGEDS